MMKTLGRAPVRLYDCPKVGVRETRKVALDMALQKQKSSDADSNATDYGTVVPVENVVVPQNLQTN